MIQDIAPHVFHNEYQPERPDAEDTVLAFQPRKVLARGAAGEEIYPKVKDIGQVKGKLYYLFRIDEEKFFLYLPDDPVDISEYGAFDYVPLYQIRSSAGLAASFACMTGYHLYTWYDKHRFCGHCGNPLEHDDKQRMLRCPSCGATFFPVIMPAVIVGVIDGERLLMTRYAGREYTGWALIAGFCEIGESVEETVCREVMEEAGVRVKNLRYVASQPWGSDSDLLFGVFCEADGDKSIHMDQEELSQALWVDRQDVPVMKDNLSLTGHMIELFRTGKEKD